MKKRIAVRTLSASLALLGVAGGLSIAPTAAQKQQTQPAGTRLGTRPVQDVLASIGQQAGVTVVGDATVRDQRVPLPTMQATAGTVEERIAAVVSQLPQGTTWAKLYLPAPPAGRGWSGDDVAAYAFAQKRLFGSVGGAPMGTVEVMGQQLPADRAQSVVATLNLRPVYLVTNPTVKAAPAAGDAANFAQMTPEQQQEYAAAQARAILAMPPEQRRQAMQQMFQRQTPERAIMGQMFRQMTPEQRQQMGQEMGFGRGGRGGDRGRPGGQGGQGGQRGPRGPRGPGGA